MSASRTSKSDNTKSSSASPIFDGRLNLEQQRKCAKELLRALHSGRVDAQTRFTNAGHGVSPSEIGNILLADAQLVIARENGFASWPKLKHHIDRITEQNRQIAAGTPPVPDTRNTLHLRCGSDIRNGLEIAGFIGDFLEFADPFCQGPVPDLPLDQFVAVRAEFIASSYQIAPKDALARNQREYGALTTLAKFDHVVLWFEHDSYDQLILAFLMDFIAATKPATRIDLISVGNVPGIDRFIGLGQLSPELLIWCWENHRVAVSDVMLETGRTAWKAIRSATPDALKTFIQAGAGANVLPHLIPALERHIAELPDPKSGLGLTQKLALQIGADHGPLPVGKIFSHLIRSYDPLPYLGDLMFWSEIQTMMKCTAPLFTLSGDQDWPNCIFTITETGSDTLAGTQNFLDNVTGTRWVGGIEVSPGNKELFR